MGRKEKQKAKKTEHEEEEQEHGSPMGSTPPLVFEVSSDDDEANEDLSLRIVEKALLKRKLPRNHGVSNGDDVVVLGASSSQQDEAAVARNDGVLNEAREVVGVSDSEELKSERRKKSKSKKKKVKKVESEEHNVVSAEGQVAIETVETAKPIKEAEKDEPTEEAAIVQMGDNVVLRKLLRGPRYFDAPDSGWGTCYNCGEEGHAAVNCTAAKRKKPCYVCGSFEHNAKHCTMGRDCYICKKGGHRAKDCPEKSLVGSQSLKMCLKCGDSGHEMFSCKNDYLPEDLKEVQCYVCKKFGHLCCVNTADSRPRVISCYQCGRLGHTGLACARLRTEAADIATPSSCYRCGEAGHFARECTSSVKGGKRRRESSNTKTPKFQKENDYDYVGYRSAPHDIDKPWKKKKPFTEEKGSITTPRKPKHRGGWMTEHPADFSPSKSKRNSWRSPATPSSKSSKVHSYRSESYTPKSNLSKIRKFHEESPNPRRSPHSYQTRFSASRFGNSSGDGYGRSYNWW